MATINFSTREITAKIVYFGASGAGCNTNVERLWNLVKGQKKSPLHRFGPRGEEERSWYFDFIPLRDPPVEGFQLVWRIYSLPGGIDVSAHREEVVSNVDAVVFVADARSDRSQSNLDHLLELEAMLTRTGLELSAIPVVIQVNHADAADARTTDEVIFDLNPYGFPVVEAVAKEGAGVEETHAEIATSVVARVRDTLAGEDVIPLTAVHADALTDADVIRQHVENIQHRSEATPHTAMDEVAPDDPGLLEGPTVELAFQPQEFVGSHPVRVQTAVVTGEGVLVVVEMKRMGGGDSRPLAVLLRNRPVDTDVLTSASPVAVAASSGSSGSVFDHLPDQEEVDRMSQRGRDLPPMWYGLLGVTSGAIIGLLLAYLFGVFL
ncbi:MAG: GTPase domain-containing protein [Myxococcales bacterium]|nr:GTPase domain-containing protein [Myxococcales bacterium]